MEIKGIDVSGYQGSVDWKQVKKFGVEFAILKVIRKDLDPDKQFENNWLGCKSNDIAIGGVYNYSYATSVDKARIDAERVVEVLNGRKTIVWLDVEDVCQKNLGIELIRIINTYEHVIKSAGLEFGVYTGLSFYNSFFKPYEQYINWRMWIAKYGKNKGEYVPTSKPPVVKNMAGWQHTSKATIPGIVGKVDANVFYCDIQTGQVKNVSYPILKKGDHNNYVLAWQIYLNLNGYDCGKEDGWFGVKTEAAVIEFQEDKELNADGIIGYRTWRKVNK